MARSLRRRRKQERRRKRRRKRRRERQKRRRERRQERRRVRRRERRPLLPSPAVKVVEASAALREQAAPLDHRPLRDAGACAAAAAVDLNPPNLIPPPDPPGWRDQIRHHFHHPLAGPRLGANPYPAIGARGPGRSPRSRRRSPATSHPRRRHPVLETGRRPSRPETLAARPQSRRQVPDWRVAPRASAHHPQSRDTPTGQVDHASWPDRRRHQGQLACLPR